MRRCLRAVKADTALAEKAGRGPGARCEGVRLITLYLPESYLRALDELVEERYYPSRAEAIRVAIRDLLNKEFWGKAEKAREKKPRGRR